MQTLKELITRAQGGDLKAYDETVRRFQDMAVSYGYSLLGDFHRAEDAAQEAFLEAFCRLPRLQEPLAFPGWLRRLVFKHCDRSARRRQVPAMPLDAAFGLVSDADGPHGLLEAREAASQVRGAVALLPEHERVVTLLFYIGQHSQAEIADFLQVPVSTVKKRLHTARARLKERMIEMITEDLEENRPSRTPRFAERVEAFTVQFSQMIETGQSLVRSLAMLADREPDTDLRQIFVRLQQDVTGDGRSGATLSEAMQKHPDVFSQSYVDAVRQGEVGGTLASVLQQLAAASTPPGLGERVP